MDKWTKIVLAVLVMFIFWNFIRKDDAPSEYNKFIETQLNGCQSMDLFSQNKEAFSPSYEKELALFKTMTLSEQQIYLNLSKDQKYAMYGNKL